MPVLIGVSLVAALILAVLLPLLFAELMVTSFAKLHLSDASAGLIFLTVVVGGFINIPLRRVRTGHRFSAHPLAAYGLSGYWPDLKRTHGSTTIAVNVGGCVIPLAVAAYELVVLIANDPHLLGALLTAITVNIITCYAVAQPVPGVGITMPAMIPGLVSAGLALLLAPSLAPPVAFIAGVVGPLIGADILHMRSLEKVPAAVISIGGAGTFDGIVLSGIIAAYLA